MNITKELLSYLKVVSTNLVINEKDNLCFIERQEKDAWSLRLQDRLSDCKEGDSAFLKIRFANEASEYSPVTIKEIGIDYCEVTIPSLKSELNTQKIVQKFFNLEYKDEQYGHRKEKRLSIGTVNSEKFCLARPEQQFYLPSAKTVQVCAIKDASVHGICVVTNYHNDMRVNDVFNVLVSFKNPDEKILLKAHKVHVKLNDTSEGNTMATISCQLLEPVHFRWKERVIAMLCGGEK